MELLTKECTGCMACYNKCPNKAISITYNEIGCYIPKIDETKCTNCNLCNLVCPQLKKIEEKETPKTCYAIMGKDEIRKNSASGGLFATIAKEYLKNGNYVCGDVFSSDFKQVNHEIINKEEDLIRIQNSKYVQSNMGNILKEIKNLLDKNKEVLFGGTPCQVAGLKSYLEKEYVNLLTIDIICHGNPSPLVWEKYVSEITKNKPLSNVLFRNKKNGWHYSGEVEFCFKNNFFKQKIKDKLFYKSFFGHLILNEACYNCKYTNLHRPADVTIGDFWGIEQYDSDMDDKKGTSVAIIHTKKGQEIFDKYNDKFHKIKEFDIEVAISGNNRLESPSKRNYDTKNFCKNLHSMPVIKNLKKELSPKYEGIIKNLWETTNFGASLSAWALQQYLFQKGKNYHILKRYQPAPYTYEFGNKHLKTTHVVSSEEEYKQLNKNCDNFIIGTDQVLRPIIIEKTIDKDLLGYTSFNKKRIAFSASFGMKYLEKMSWTNRIKYKKLIKRFDAF